MVPFVHTTECIGRHAGSPADKGDNATLLGAGAVPMPRVGPTSVCGSYVLRLALRSPQSTDFRYLNLPKIVS